MAGALTRERVRRDIEVLARAGLDTATFMAEVDASLRRAVPYDAACMVTVDPATHLLTSTYKFGDLAGRNDRDHEWAQVEYGGDDPTAFGRVARRDDPACAVHHETGGRPWRSLRMRAFIGPEFGYVDELRMAARDGTRAWGGLALFRTEGEQPFDEAEIAYVGSLSATYAAGLRSGLLVRLGADVATDHAFGPTVLLVGPDDRLSGMSVGAEQMLADLTGDPNMADATGVVGGLVAGARRYAAGHAEVLPRARVRLRSGRWLVLHASPLAGRDASPGDVVVTIEEARPPEIVPLVVAAFDLTAREREVVQLVLQGVDTKEIAATLHMSRYTVQDHLKSVFEKAEVRSRRELTSRVFFDQYSPRIGGDLAPSGWFAPGGDEALTPGGASPGSGAAAVAG